MEVKSQEEAKAAVKRGADLCVLLGAAIASRNKEVLAVEEKRGETISQLSADITAVKAALEAWAKANRAAFGDKQSLEFPAGALVFRVGNRAIELLPRWTWPKVRAAMKRLKNYLRPKVEINKQLLLSHSAGDKPKLTRERLASIGVRVEQEETFDVEFKVEAELGKAGDVDERA